MPKRRRVLSISASERYGIALLAQQEPEEDAWGHFVDLAEEEEKIIRRSRILSRGSSFASVVSEL